MPTYTCMDCEQDVELESVAEKIICPHCSSRIFLKTRPPTPKTVKAE